MLFETKGLRVFVYTEAIDMRSGFDRLLYYARDKMKAQIDQGHLYLFFGKNRRRLKATSMAQVLCLWPSAWSEEASCR